ncbi:hypothetical protein AB0L40_11545 [Patulibacter sp. NPDC049589]|uniref:hypothetical protein n=1 Tax=Patulibacter sp. NPDC049589 TaxID=3154731 RepID=UPI00343FF245
MTNSNNATDTSSVTEDEDAVDRVRTTDLASRALAVLLVAATVVVAIAATVGWTVWVTGFLPGLGYVTVPACLYVLSIALIPLLGIAHRLWVSGDVVARAETAKRHERDRLRTTLLHADTPSPAGRKKTTHAYELPEDFFRGESDDDVRRRRQQDLKA